jgi:hypothetical protein
MKEPIILDALFPVWMGRRVGSVRWAALKRAGIDPL